MPGTKPLSLTLLLIACLCCTSAKTVSDSVGIEIVESATAIWGAEHPWTFDSVPLISIGTAEGNPKYQLAGIKSAVRLSDGRLAVLNPNMHQIHIFDTRGDLVRSFGRLGDGPGDLKFPTVIFNTPGDTLIVWQDSYFPTQSFDTLGHPHLFRKFDLARLGHDIGNGRYAESFTPIAAGSFIAHVTGGNEQWEATPVGTVFRKRLEFVAFDTGYASSRLGEYGGASQDMIADKSNMRYGKKSEMQLAPAEASAAGGGTPLRMFAADGDSFVVNVFDEHGTPLRIIRRTTPRIEFAADVQAKYATLLHGAPPQKYCPAIYRMLVDVEGNLWTMGLCDGWNVFDLNGRWLGGVNLPNQGLFEPTEIGRDYMVGVTTDNDGVERVKEYRLRKKKG